MKNQLPKILSVIILAALILTACAQTEPTPTSVAVTPELNGSEKSEVTESIAPTVESQPEALSTLLLEDIFSGDSTFCLPEVETSAFTLKCDQNTLRISQNENRRKSDIFLFRDSAVEAETVNLEAVTTSIASVDVKSDQNVYGFYIVDSVGVFQALRIQGTYFNFESGIRNAELEIEEQTNPSFSPQIRLGGQENHWKMVCGNEICEAYANDTLIGRVPAATNGEITAAGVFTASAWDESFGEVIFSNLALYNAEELLAEAQPFILEDELKSDEGTFSQTGMSGAFSDYDADGFHFSPVIPYGYYGAKTGPALRDVEISAKVKMDIDTDRPGSQYGGLICRSSQDGMYMAVIGVDGTYTIYRDTPQSPFALLAEKRSDAILPGYTENELKLVCQGNSIEFYINGTMVESFKDQRYGLIYGRAGIYTKAGGDPQPDAIIFSDLSIRELR